MLSAFKYDLEFRIEEKIKRRWARPAVNGFLRYYWPGCRIKADR